MSRTKCHQIFRVTYLYSNAIEKLVIDREPSIDTMVVLRSLTSPVPEHSLTWSHYGRLGRGRQLAGQRWIWGSNSRSTTVGGQQLLPLQLSWSLQYCTVYARIASGIAWLCIYASMDNISHGAVLNSPLTPDFVWTSSNFAILQYH